MATIHECAFSQCHQVLNVVLELTKKYCQPVQGTPSESLSKANSLIVYISSPE